MQPLIDGDILRYEIGAIGDIDGPKSFEFVQEVLDGRIRDICFAVNATEEPIIYLTGSQNFRNEIAVTKPYKGTRKEEKPYHFRNITTYLHNQYRVVLHEGLEADDLMSIEQTRRKDQTVICSRDKDLRMVPGFHYGWECGAQREWGPRFVEPLGDLELTDGKPKKISGTGLKFFYSQLLTGDTVDNIPGCPGVGAVKAYSILKDLTTEREMYQAVRNFYAEKDLTEEYFREQVNLLWMVQDLNEDGSPVLWRPPDEL